MGLRQLHTAETMFIDDGLTDGAVFPPSSNAVYDALQSAIELPSVTAEDDGDVLTVVSGAWAKATPAIELPSVTAEDDGDVLTVVEGAWTKATPSGGVVSGTITYDDDVATLSMSVNEIYSAIEDGKLVQFVDSDDGLSVIYQVIGARKDDHNSVYAVICMSYSDESPGVVELIAYEFTASSADGNPSFDFSQI